MLSMPKNLLNCERMRVLLTGGTGYIGSHTAVLLHEVGYEVVLLDNFTNSQKLVLNQIEKITRKKIPFIEADVRDENAIKSVIRHYNIQAVIHLAGLKAVSESVDKPIEYYDNNVNGTISLIKAMINSNIKKLIFSSSAAVYGNPQYLPIDESHPTFPTTPYGRTKLQIEKILADIAHSDRSWRITCLRYFNPVGAHESGLIGENPKDIPTNLMPYIMNVALKLEPYINIFGNDYKTPDGSGVRDYIHVIDLAEGHIAALNNLEERQTAFDVFNLGSGHGRSVFEMIHTFEHISGQKIPMQIVSRRPGDVESCYANADKAKKTLKWVSRKTLEEMCKDMWRFQRKNRFV